MGNEVFKDVTNYKGLYQISNLGNVKSLGNNKIRKEKILKNCLSKKGYLVVNLSKNGVFNTKKIHQLVAESFLNHTPCGMKLVVNHIDFNKTNNKLENLEVITQRENSNQKHIKSTSKYVGVSWAKSINKWVSHISINGVSNHLGIFDTEIEASNSYRIAKTNLKNTKPCQ